MSDNDVSRSLLAFHALLCFIELGSTWRNCLVKEQQGKGLLTSHQGILVDTWVFAGHCVGMNVLIVRRVEKYCCVTCVTEGWVNSCRNGACSQRFRFNLVPRISLSEMVQTSLFFYGTLMHPKILKRVIRNDGAHLQLCSALLLVSRLIQAYTLFTPYNTCRSILATKSKCGSMFWPPDFVNVI